MARKTAVSTPFIAALWHCSVMVAIAVLYNNKEWEAATLGSFVAATVLAGITMQPLLLHLAIVVAGAATAASANTYVALACSTVGFSACSGELLLRFYYHTF